MWRQLVRFLPRINPFHPRYIPKRKLPLSVGKLILLASTAPLTLDQGSNEDLGTPVDELQFSPEFKLVADASNEALNNLIQTLNICVREICDQYQECVPRQIDIVAQCADVDTADSLWDDLIKFRVLADDLRQELLQYRTLATTIGAIVCNETGVAKVKERVDSPDLDVRQAYQELLNTIEELMRENGTWDSKLLSAHTRSILLTQAN